MSEPDEQIPASSGRGATDISQTYNYVVAAVGLIAHRRSPVPVDLNPGVLKEQCYPPSSEAIRSVIDGVIVASVAGVTWVWHLRRGRRALDEPLLAG